MALILDARVKQKIATEAEWMADDTVLLEGEQAFVLSGDGYVRNFKIGDGTKTFVELPYSLDYTAFAAIAPQPLAPADPAPTTSGLYIPTVDGDYTNIGLTVDRGTGGADEGKYIQFINDNGTWMKVGTPMPKSENKIPVWDPEEPGPRVQGDQRIHNGQIWQVAVASTTEEPGTGTDWKPAIDAVTDSYVDPTIEKSDKAFTLSPEGTTEYVSTQELPVSFYGGSVYGWGFPIGTPGGSFQTISVRLGNNDSIAITEAEIRIKKNNVYGQLLAVKRQPVSIDPAEDALISFDLGKEVSGKDRIWVEVYTNATSQVYRTGTTASIFTESEGYPQLATMTGTANLDGNVAGEAGFMDIYAGVTVINKKLEATQELKGIIQEEVKSTPLTEFPETVQDSVSVTDSLFQITGTSEEVYKPTGELEVSFYGTNTYGWGFHAGVVKNFSKVGIRIKTHQNSTVPITEVEIRVKENDWDGALLAKVRMNVNIPISEDSIITATLPQEIANESGQKIWLEIYTNALSQAYRTGTSAQIFTAENGYTVARRTVNNDLDGEVETTLTYFDFYSEFTRSSKTIELTPLGEQVLKSEASLSGKSVAFLGDSIIMNFSSQYTDHDTQDWIQMQEKLGVSELINCGIGGATWKDRGDENNTSSPQRGTATAYISNEIRMLKRLITEGRITPDLIVISAGTNDSNQTDNYDAVMGMTFSQLEADEVTRETLYGGLRYCMEWLMNDFPDSQVIVVTPFQSATGAHRTFENQQEKGDYIKKMAKRFSIPVIDQFSECGIVDYYEVDGGNGRYLVDGVHLNADGKALITEYLYQNIMTLYNPWK